MTTTTTPLPRKKLTNHTPTRDPLAAIQAVEVALNRQFLEREDVISAMLDAAVAGEHVCLVGPPGTAKSELVRSFARCVTATSFEYLLTRHTKPEELFGPVDLQAFKTGTYRHVVTGMLPEAQMAFLDEAFKASSAILNTLLAVLNERIFHNPGPTTIPLHTCVLASNELPEDAALAALWDRALVRVEVKYLADESHRRHLLFGARAPAPAGLATLDDLQALATKAQTLPVTDACQSAVLAIQNACREKGVAVSDRRWVKAVALVRAHATRKGASEVTEDHLDPLRHVLWSRLEQQAAVREILAVHASPWLEDVRAMRHALDEQKVKLAVIPKHAQGDLATKLRNLAELASVSQSLVVDAEKLVQKFPRAETQELLKQAAEFKYAVISASRS